MRRLLPFSLPILLLATGIAACGSDEGGALDTLPVIRTTTSTTTTTTVPDARRKFYEVKAGDNIADIAAELPGASLGDRPDQQPR